MITSSRARFASSGVISGSGLAIAKMIGSGAIPFYHFRRQRSLGRQPEENIRALERFLERSQRRFNRVRGLPLIHALLTAAIDDALRVARMTLAGFEPDRLDQVEAGDASGERAVPTIRVV